MIEVAQLLEWQLPVKKLDVHVDEKTMNAAKVLVLGLHGIH